MELSCTLSFSCVLFVILVKGFVCQSDNLAEMCLDEYGHEIETVEDQVLHVCVDSPISNITDTVYMDMSKVPRFENYTCFCTVIFTNELEDDLNIVREDDLNSVREDDLNSVREDDLTSVGEDDPNRVGEDDLNSVRKDDLNSVRENDLNSVRLDYKIESSTEALTVNGYGYDRFSTNNDVHVVGTILKVNNVTFTLKSPGTAFKACLRITSAITDAGESLFRAKCFSRQFTPEINTYTSTKTSTTPSSTTAGKPRTETEFGSTSTVLAVMDTESENDSPLGFTVSLVEGTDTGSDNKGHSGAVIGGAAGGGAVLVIITCIVVLLVIKRKKTKNTKAKDEAYYMTENELYNVRNSSINSANENTHDTYDEIEAANQTRESRVYTDVDAHMNKPNDNTKTSHTVDENDYNHLNDLKGPVSTGNILLSR